MKPNPPKRKPASNHNSAGAVDSSAPLQSGIEADESKLSQPVAQADEKGEVYALIDDNGKVLSTLPIHPEVDEAALFCDAPGPEWDEASRRVAKKLEGELLNAWGRLMIFSKLARSAVGRDLLGEAAARFYAKLIMQRQRFKARGEYNDFSALYSGWDSFVEAGPSVIPTNVKQPNKAFQQTFDALAVMPVKRSEPKLRKWVYWQVGLLRAEASEFSDPIGRPQMMSLSPAWYGVDIGDATALAEKLSLRPVPADVFDDIWKRLLQPHLRGLWSSCLNEVKLDGVRWDWSKQSAKVRKMCVEFFEENQ